jgi:ribosomal protein S2
MKIKKIQRNKRYKLLKFNLIHSKIIKKNHLKIKISADDIETRLKKALKLIFFYHVSNKKILFVGNPLNINKEISKLLNKTKHIFIPNDAWTFGMITNVIDFSFPSYFFKKEKKNLNILCHKIAKIKKKSDLVVIIDENNEVQALKESYSTRLPVITLNSNLNPFEDKPSYKIPGNFICSKSKTKNNFFYLILLTTLKKAQKIKKKNSNKLKSKIV